MTITEQAESSAHAPVEFRSAKITAVNFAQRLIEVIAAPYDEEAIVEYRGRMLRESFERGAFDDLATVRPGRIRVNRDHVKAGRTCGKVMKWHPSRDEGLVAEVRIANTPLGEETLALADEEMLSASLGFWVKGSQQEIRGDRRRVRKAGVDHLSFVEDSAYEGARVLSVRGGILSPDSGLSPMPATPLLDEVLAWLPELAKG